MLRAKCPVLLASAEDWRGGVQRIGRPLQQTYWLGDFTKLGATIFTFSRRRRIANLQRKVTEKPAVYSAERPAVTLTTLRGRLTHNCVCMLNVQQ